MTDLLTIIAEKARAYIEAEQLWLSTYPEYEYTQNEDVVIFWKCSCGEINASVISKGAKRCVRAECNVTTLVPWMKEFAESII